MRSGRAISGLTIDRILPGPGGRKPSRSSSREHAVSGNIIIE